MRFFKTTLPIMLAFVMAVAAISTTFVSHHYSDNFMQETTVWSRVIGGMTMFIGAYSLLRLHYGKIKRQQKGWGYSALLYVFFGLMVFFGILNFGIRTVPGMKVLTEAEAKDALAAAVTQNAQAKQSVVALIDENGKPLTAADEKTPPAATQPAATQPTAGRQPLFVLVSDGKMDEKVRPLIGRNGKPLAGAGGKALFVDLTTGRVSDKGPTGVLGPLQPKTTQEEGGRWIYSSVQQPASSTQYSLLGFFICSAAYRTFRAKTVEAAFLLVAALIVMLGQVPISAMISEKIPMLSGWLLDVPNMAVKRAILFGICVGSVGTSLRVMFGIERSYMGGD